MSKGEENYAAYFGHPRATPARNEFDKLTLDHLFGDIYARVLDNPTQRLDLRDRALVNVAVLTALGCGDELKQHIHAFFHHGFTRLQFEELMIHVAHYAGWPAGHLAMKMLSEIDASGSAVRSRQASSQVGPQPTSAIDPWA